MGVELGERKEHTEPASQSQGILCTRVLLRLPGFCHNPQIISSRHLCLSGSSGPVGKMKLKAGLSFCRAFVELFLFSTLMFYSGFFYYCYYYYSLELEMATQYSCLENPTDREAWWATGCGVLLLSFYFYFLHFLVS